jgi:hypothetical protein
MELSESSIAVFRNGGWFGVGTSKSEFLTFEQLAPLVA